MASESVTEAGVQAAIQRLANVQGILAMVTRAMEAEDEGALWAAGEALTGAIALVEQSYITLNDSSVAIRIGKRC